MNSSQRRLIRRHFIFTVTVPASHAEQYFKHDEKIEDIRAWCRKQFQKDNWYLNQHWNQSEFKFVKESDAVLFSLKWV